MDKRKKLIWQLPFLLLLIVGTVLIIYQQQNMPYRKCEGPIFGTTYHVTYQSDKDLQGEIEEALKRVDASLSPFNPNSVITKVNNNEDVVVDKLFADVFRIALQVSKETDGAFDITVGPLMELWGFHGKRETLPAEAEIQGVLPDDSRFCLRQAGMFFCPDAW